MSKETQAGAHWLTVSQAAAALGVSERTVRRRCEAGKLAARLDTTATGPAWLIEAQAVRAGSGDAPHEAQHGAQIGNEAADTAAIPAASFEAPADTLRPEIEGTAAIAADTAASGDTTSPAPVGAQNDYTARLIEAQAGEIEFLRGQIEAQRAEYLATIEAERREAALTIAALRDAIKAMPKGLPAPGDAPGDAEAPHGAQIGAHRTEQPARRRGWFARTFLRED